MTGKGRHDDLNILARSIVARAIGEEPPAKSKRAIGGKKGGKARARKLTPEQRAEIARIAAEARWRRAKL